MHRKKSSGTEICHSTQRMAGDRKPNTSSQSGKRPEMEIV
jgi:hypothetical protein